jgi:hypothetical protein
LVSCSVKSKNAEESFQYWSGRKPPKQIELIEGEYYKSPHFSLEYALFLKFKSDENWFYEFVKQNKLKINKDKKNWTKLTEFPDWFKPNTQYLIFCKNPKDEFERSRYFIDPESRMCYFYETLGM